VLAYLEEGYRAWQARDGASADVVRETMKLSVEEDMDFQQQLKDLDLIGGRTSRDDGDYRLLPKGIALMDGSPTLDSLLALPAAALEKAPTPQEGTRAKIEWRKVVMEEAIKVGIRSAWDSRGALWDLMRTMHHWLPAQIPPGPMA
jgi:hypothetical protein